MEADFSGYATKAGLKCTDGRTIMPDAFKHQDTMKVPLVWQHGHNDPENVLGHAILENREDGVYCYGFFNDSAKAMHTHGLIEHKDITMMSIWANDLIERAGRVLHGAIREVSLVLSGANPGAVIENVTLRHSDMDDTTLDDEAIIYTGLSFEHSSNDPESPAEDANEPGGENNTVQDIYDSMTEEQQNVLHYMIGEALALDDEVDETEGNAQHSSIANPDETMQETYDSMTEAQQNVLHYMVGEAASTAQHDNLDGEVIDGTNNKEGNDMKHNVFEGTGTETDTGPSLSHDDMQGIIADATRKGSLKDAVEDYALSHGIDNISTLFPEAVASSQDPNFLSRRIEWVSTLLGGVQKSPFSRIKTLNADITIDEARAKGYVKGAMKKEEFFGVARRVTTPTTIYKKQAMDRDDVVDITDFDVVTWLKNEMRLMLDEELARAILIGDGRDISDADKISESNIRPIAKEHELFATTIVVNTRDTGSNADEIVDAVIASRWQYKGTGMPTFFTSETVLASFLLMKDTLGRRIYSTVDDVASVLRVAAIVPVEAMELQYNTGNTANQNLLGIIVNPIDYVVGATAGGQVSMFDFFDIDYNKQKYLIETRCCGALTRLKSALVLVTPNAAATLVTPGTPTYVKATGVVTLPAAVTGVQWINVDTGVVLTGTTQTALAAYTTVTIEAQPTSSAYYLPQVNSSSSDGSFTYTFTREA